MIIKSLLFIIVCIFIYESFQIMTKMTEEYFSNLENKNNNKYSNKNNNKYNNTEKFVSLGTDAKKNDIAKTIAINCKAYENNKKKIMAYKPKPDSSLDTPYFSQFKPIQFNPKRQYLWRNDLLVPEGKRRSMDDDIEIAKVKSLLDKETDPDKQKIYEEELNLFKWRNNILSLKELDTDLDTELDRSMRDITSDYFPEEIGMNRPWIERHSHIPDYSY